MQRLIVPTLALLTGCAPMPALFGERAPEAVAPVVPGLPPEAAPDPATTGLPGANVPATGPLGRKGTTVAALGDPSRPGAWMETPLVTTGQPGQVRHGGMALPVMLIPSGGPPGAGSRLSLAAMQALGLPLGDLVEVEVYAGG